MIKVALHGCAGKTCRKVFELCQKDDSIEIVAGVDKDGSGVAGFPVFGTPGEMFMSVPDIDVVVDFSDASAVKELVRRCKGNYIPMVICTTGLDQDTLNCIEDAAKVIPVMRSANMSIGVNMLLSKIGNIASVLMPQGFDVEIVESHHNQKLDAPSGTAIALADAVADGAGYARTGKSAGTSCDYVFDRSKKHEKRGRHEIGISSVRGGTITGKHEIIFAGEDEVITISHEAYSKAVFAKGAVAAAKVMAEYGRNDMAGLFDMSEIMK